MLSTTVVVFEITGVLFFVITAVMSLKLAMIVYDGVDSSDEESEHELV